jgi:hypothetical protein
MPNLYTKAHVSLFRLSLDNTGFLINGDGHQLIWIPTHLRGEEIAVDTNSCTVAIAGSSGAITIIRFLRDSL